MKKITKKLLASVLTFIIFFAELSTLGMYGIAYATEARDTATSNQNVEFDVYFSNEKREIVSPYTYQRREKIKIPSYVWYILIATLVIVVGYVIISHLQNDDFKSDEITYVERG